MTADTVPDLDAAIRDAKARIDEQRRLIAEFAAKGYDTSAPLTLLSCLHVNLSKLERRRRELTRMIDDIVLVA